MSAPRGTRRHAAERRPRSGFLVIVGGSFAVQAMALATGIIMARLLGVEGRGQIALVAAVSALVAKLTLGGSLPVAIAQLLARDGLRARDALRPFVGRWTLLGVACGAVAAGYLFWVLRDEAAGLRLGLTAGVAVMTFQMIVGGILSGALQGEVASASRLVVGGLALQAPFFLTLVTLFALGWEGDAAELVGLQVTTTVLGIYLSWRLLRPSTGTGPALDRGEVRSVTRANYVNAVGSINGVGLDRNLVGGLLGTAPLGLYSTATAVANMSTIVGTAVSTVLLPRLSAAHDQPEQRRRLLRQWLPATAILMLMIVAGLQLVVGPVIEVAFGAEFAPAVEVARWLIVADGLLGYRRVLGSVLQAQGRGSVASWIELVLTGLLALGIVVAALNEDLTQVGQAVFVVGVLSCLSLLVAILRPRRRRRTAPPRPASHAPRRRRERRAEPATVPPRRPRHRS